MNSVGVFAHRLPGLNARGLLLTSATESINGASLKKSTMQHSTVYMEAIVAQCSRVYST